MLILSIFMLFTNNLSMADEKFPPEIEPNSIVCSFTNIDGDQNYGDIKIKLTKDGKIETVSGMRPKIEKEREFKFRFTNINAKFKHTEEDNCPEKDADTGEPICKWGIKKVESITAVNKFNKEKIYLRINDHFYSGVPGSTIKFYRNGKQINDTGDMMGSCGGKILHPLKSEAEKELEGNSSSSSDFFQGEDKNGDSKSAE